MMTTHPTNHTSQITHLYFAVVCFIFASSLHARVLEVGTGAPYATLSDAVRVVVPGDTILVRGGVHSGGLFLADLQGRSDAWITIMGEAGAEVIYRGGGNAWQLSDPAYLRIAGFIFEGQSGNGLNIDDGGSYETPAHHIIIERCEWRALNATGNNDQLKMSGVDSFLVRNCRFLNGAGSGSMIDMVGCHDGAITECTFENAGSNAVQLKGGSMNVRVERSTFRNAGQRGINIGGSTGAQFFRPLNAPAEAAKIFVHSNVFIGGITPFAFVGGVECEVIHNTIDTPERWGFRILQENTNLVQCGDNVLRNNIFYLGNASSNPAVNIGPNTRPETFVMSNNLWYDPTNPTWTPSLPVTDVNAVLQREPLFFSVANNDYRLQRQSPAIGAGYPVTVPQRDHAGQLFALPRSIGAFEPNPATSVESVPGEIVLHVYPHPTSREGIIQLREKTFRDTDIELLDFHGRSLGKKSLNGTFVVRLKEITSKNLPPGLYYLILTTYGKRISKRIIVR